MFSHILEPMGSAVGHWHAEHVYYTRLLDLLDKELAVFHAGGRPDYALMRDVVHYLRHFPDRYHHPREDAAFRRLVRRDPDTKLPVERLQQQHRVLAAAADELLHRLDEVIEDAVVSRSAVEAAVATYLTYYRHHIATEEHEVLPRAATLLSLSDWAAVAAAVPESHDPLFGEDFEPRYRELRRRIALEANGAARPRS